MQPVSDIIRDLKVPAFCEHYEPLLVEEIILESHPSQIHYGKCAVIGYLQQNSFFLESLKEPCLPEKFHLADGTCKLKVQFDNYRGDVPRNSTVRLYGTVKLVSSSPDSAMDCSKDLAVELKRLHQELQQNPNAITLLEKQWDQMRYDYTPILDVYGCERIRQARELITANLRLKRINKILKPKIEEMEREMFG
ncbi:uncharacterized protein LOC129751026 [Uranotaenia lowii]|uniref:uncharacterized protein LOC129751026 n=1 Tax=Uranotaenia lowii TaxID=190385 RepID=UPI002479666F|nr:uncharacterized protein LOC129751026 [Uranotaenia lowii]XP_055602245.1 uncharacterized protein LOC129751026 [Uranotaenia lowii]XP_055602246.1 uncharacterized protein LOC129751026 [Uranotaenia lowii]XP_055602247.1 uncharacterized protein LOC129751026 [Uranotaenia lowii]